MKWPPIDLDEFKGVNNTVLLDSFIVTNSKYPAASTLYTKGLMFANGAQLGNESIKEKDCFVDLFLMHHMTPVQKCSKVSCNAIKVWRKDTDTSHKVKVSYSFSEKVYTVIVFTYEIVLVR